MPVICPLSSYCSVKNFVVVLAHEAVSSILLMPLNVIVKPDVVLSTLVVGAGVPPGGIGALVGAAEGLSLGVKLGEDVGDRVIVTEGDTDGVAEGFGVVGEALGSNVGVDVGVVVGNLVGPTVGDCVFATGDFSDWLGKVIVNLKEIHAACNA